MIKDLIIQLAKNRFYPTTDNPEKLPDDSGVYLICTNSLNCLPTQMRSLEYKQINDDYIVYVGIAGRPTSRKKSLRNRDYKNHFNGNARGSTLRKSLGVLLGFNKLQDPKEIGTSKYRFIPEHEAELSHWMKENLFLHFIKTDLPLEIEALLIKELNPPLNIKDNCNQINSDFRKQLSNLRCSI